MSGEQPEGAPGLLALVTPDGVSRLVADNLAFPNGMVITPDNRTLIVGESFAAQLTAFDVADDGTLSNRRTWAKDVGPDGICIDAEGGIWCSSAVEGNGGKDAVRFTEGGEAHERIELDRFCFATALQRRTGCIYVCDVAIPGVGWP